MLQERLPPGVEMVRDVSHADWALDRQVVDRRGLPGYAPSGFEANVRVFHPLSRHEDDPFSRMTWAELAEQHDVTMRPDISLSEVVGFGPRDWNRQEVWAVSPELGYLDQPTCTALVRILRAHTTTLDTCWFCLGERPVVTWDPHHVWTEEDADVKAALEQAKREAEAAPLATFPMVELGNGMSYFLFRGPLESAFGFRLSGDYTPPHLWWPEDHAWLVTTDEDDDCTLVGGSRAVIDGVLASPDLEAMEVPLGF